MNEQIYTLLNEIDNQPDSYEIPQVTDLEMKKWKKQFSSRRVSRRSRKKYVAAAAIVCILGGSLLFPPAQFIAYAGMKTVTYNLSQLLGIQKDLSPYRTMVGKSISKDGYTVTLNDVVLDENILYISDTFTLPQKNENFLEQGGTLADVNVFINGKMVSWGASGGTEQADDYNLVSSRRMSLDSIDASQNLDIELHYSMGGKSIGSFSFTATGKDLMASTYTVSLDTTITLPDKTAIRFYKYSSNAMGQRIYFKTSTPDTVPAYHILLKGEDNLGNPVEFSIRTIHTGIGCMEVDTLENGYVSDDAQTLTLTPYIAKMPQESGQMSNDYQPAGDSFTVTVK